MSVWASTPPSITASPSSAAPSGAYYAEGLDPVRIYVEDQYIRAAPGLTGFTKCGGNYAASIKAGELAEEQRLLRRFCGWTAWRRSTSRKSAP